MADLTPKHWLITTFKGPVIFNRGTVESWYLNPVRRYVFNAAHLTRMASHVESVSDLANAPDYRPLRIGGPLQDKTVLVERFRDRGIGDLLFLTGPFAFLHHISGNQVRIHPYAFSDRGQVLLNSPFLDYGTVLVGPTHYDDFAHYDYQWMIESGTEANQEQDQLNVYDALYASMGIKPAQVDPVFKRPYATVLPKEQSALDHLFYQLFLERHLDLRKTGYYVVAPFTHSALRAAPYSFWLNLCKELALRRPVIVIGQLHEGLPDLDMAVGEFVSLMHSLGDYVVNLLDSSPGLPLRSAMALISKAKCVFTLDTGPLYIAQALRIPAVSIWGPHHPGIRIGYDLDYMDLAVWNNTACNKCPCFCYGSFPYHKCPDGSEQRICSVLCHVTPEQVLAKLDQVECRVQFSLPAFKAKA